MEGDNLIMEHPMCRQSLLHGYHYQKSGVCSGYLPTVLISLTIIKYKHKADKTWIKALEPFNEFYPLPFQPKSQCFKFLNFDKFVRFGPLCNFP